MIMLVESLLAKIYREEEVLGRELTPEERAELAENWISMMENLGP